MAGIQSHYEFNVSKNGKHVFATADRSAITASEAVKLNELLTTKFPSSEGYDIEMTYWKVEGLRT